MDTKLKKFNSTLIFKMIAFALCLSCVVNCTTQIMTSLYKASDSGLTDRAYDDALYELIMIDRELTETETFKYHMSRFSGIVDTMTGSYGDGSEAAYRQWKNSIGTSNEAYYKKARENIISHVIADQFRLYLALVDEGVVEPLGMLEVSEYSGNTVDIYEDDNLFFDYYSFDDLCNNQADGVVKYPKDEKLKKKAQELGADGVFKLNNYYQILQNDEYGEEEIVLESYKPGYYAFKINDEALEEKLAENNLFVIDRYGSAEEFAKHYNRYADELKKYYPSGKYFIRDFSGRVYTNVKGLDSKSTVKEIEQKFASFGFYCQKREYGEMYLPDGKYYFQGAHSAYWMDDDGVYETTTLPTVVTTTVAPVETTVVHTTVLAEKVVDGEKVTAPVAAEATTYKIDAFSSTPFVDENDGCYCMLGVDMYPDDYADTDLFKTSRFQIKTAKEILSDALLTVGLMGALFLVCFIYLIARAGRRRGSNELHLLKTDRIFTEIRIAIDGLLGFGIVLLMFSAIDEFAYDDARDVLTRLLSILAALFAVAVLDLVLFITKQIKAKTLLKNTFIGWIIVKCFGAVFGKIKKIRSTYKEKIIPVIKEKLLYTREFKKGTLIRIGIVLTANLFIGFFASIEVADNGTCFIGFPWVIFNIGVLVWVIRLIGGLHKIFSALEEIRQGNYSVYINTYALPSTLRENAEKVMSLRDGLKTAVEEAVRQEQTKTELITNVSHDLKTPLTSIINYVELLKNCNITDEDAKEYLAVLGEKSDRLKKLIEDLVEASKASTGNIKVDFVQVSLNEMVSQLLGEHADGLERRKLNVIAEIPEESVTVKADGKLLYRVMENLIVNVEKYSLYGTRVYVSVKQEGAYGTVTFKNISEQPLNITADQLKERFVRGDESRSTEGNGLGLSIAQSLCEVQGGELEISISGDLFTASVKLGR